MNKILRCALYIRVSSAEQVMHGKSLESQKEFLTDFAEQRGMRIVGIYADEGKTARKELKRRKAIKELLDRVKSDEIDVILFWKMDRWFRNVSDFYKVQEILDAHNCKWIAAAEPSMNLETREGRLNVNIMLSINQNETDTTSERIKFVNQASIKQGKAIYGNYSLPLGYKVSQQDGKTKRIIKDEKSEQIVNDFFEYYLTHHSKQGALKYLNSKYNAELTINVINTMCKSTLYCGTYGDNTNYCPAYIDKSQFEKMQVINKHNIKVRRSQLDSSFDVYLFTGLLVCPVCGRILGCAKKIRKNGNIFRYYRCINHYTNRLCTYGKVINEQTTEQYLINNIERIYYEKKILFLESVDRKKKVEKQTVDVAKYQKELDRLNSMFQKGRISEEKYDSEYELVSGKIKRYSVEKESIESIHINISKLEDLLGGNWIDLYNELTRENKRAFWRSIVNSIECHTDHGAVKDVNFLI